MRLRCPGRKYRPINRFGYRGAGKMPKICYVEKEFRQATLAIIEQANEIIEEYQAKGFDLTLRQLYYQFVARDLIPNTQRDYKNLGAIINDARLAGLVDWRAITDRTRNLQSNGHWENPGHIVSAAADSFMLDRWETQLCYVEVWIEKDALVGVVEGVCDLWDVPYFSCRGYSSSSEMWAAAHYRLRRRGRRCVILHLGDHDPSGLDMTRDIEERLWLFAGSSLDISVRRIALNMRQIEELNPPPNPAKITDSRAKGYIKEYGHNSWELDALPPEYLDNLIKNEILEMLDFDAWHAAIKREEKMKDQLRTLANSAELQNW